MADFARELWRIALERLFPPMLTVWFEPPDKRHTRSHFTSVRLDMLAAADSPSVVLGQRLKEVCEAETKKSNLPTDMKLLSRPELHRSANPRDLRWSLIDDEWSDGLLLCHMLFFLLDVEFDMDYILKPEHTSEARVAEFTKELATARNSTDTSNTLCDYLAEVDFEGYDPVDNGAMLKFFDWYHDPDMDEAEFNYRSPVWDRLQAQLSTAFAKYNDPNQYVWERLMLRDVKSLDDQHALGLYIDAVVRPALLVTKRWYAVSQPMLPLISGHLTLFIEMPSSEYRLYGKFPETDS